MKEILAAAVAVVVAALAVACGGGGSGNPTASPPGAAVGSPALSAATRIAIRTAASPAAALPSPTPVATPTIASPTAIAAALATVKLNLPGMADKAKNGDLQGAKDAVSAIGQPIEIIVTATRPSDPKLAHSIEVHKLALDDEITATPPDPITIIQHAIELGPLVDQAATLLHVAP